MVIAPRFSLAAFATVSGSTWQSTSSAPSFTVVDDVAPASS